MRLIFILIVIFVVYFVKAYAEQSGQNYCNKRKRTTRKRPAKRSGSNQK